MKQLIIILSILITLSSASLAQENSEERINEIVEQQAQAKDLNTLKQAWNSYKLADYEVAFGLWIPLAKAGNSSAQVFVGLMYDQGHAVEEDKNEAAQWYALASEQGYAPAKWRLALLYYHGAGLTQDYQKAADLYHSAAKQGDTYSQKALGTMYSDGFGVPRDKIIAYSWFQIAAGNGFKVASKYRDEVAKEMTPEETALAKAMAKECTDSSYQKCGWTLVSSNDPIEN